MFLKRANVLLLFLLNISVTLSLRFFQARKRKKKCLVREQWNLHYVTCTSKYHICCPTGCCTSAINNATTAYVKVCIVCSVIIVIFTLIYIESWCKKKWKSLRSSCTHSCAGNEVQTEENPKNSECQEMQTLTRAFPKIDVIDGGSEDDLTLSSVCSSDEGHDLVNVQIKI